MASSHSTDLIKSFVESLLSEKGFSESTYRAYSKDLIRRRLQEIEGEMGIPNLIP